MLQSTFGRVDISGFMDGTFIRPSPEFAFERLGYMTAESFAPCMRPRFGEFGSLGIGWYGSMR